MKVRELGKFIRDQRRNARLSLRKLSTLAGVSNPYLSQIERGLRRPSADILQAIAKALRISAETLYVKAGILEERKDGIDLVGHILRDTAINEKQKHVMIAVYQSFRDEARVGRPAARAPKAARSKAARPKAARPKAARPKAARPKAARPKAARPRTARPARASARGRAPRKAARA